MACAVQRADTHLTVFKSHRTSHMHVIAHCVLSCMGRALSLSLGRFSIFAFSINFFPLTYYPLYFSHNMRTFLPELE